MRVLRFVILILVIAGAFLAGLAYDREHTKSQAKERRVLYYVDPMHPAYKSDKPGIAPDCGMKLQPVYADEGPAAKDTSHADLPMGTINIDADKQQLIGVRYGFPEMTSGAGTLRAVGKVAFDETRLTRIHSKVEGWIEKVHIDFTGAAVKAGQPLLTIYSPEMLASEQEYLLALKARDILSHSTVREASTNSISLVDASRRRLELWDLSATQIQEVEETGKPIRSITVYSPATGFIIARNAFPSQRITPETELYSVADLNRVWIMADVYEADLDKICVGQSAVIGLPSDQGKTFLAHVNYIQPQLDAATRTLKIRLEAPNPNQRLKPEMFVDVDFRISAPARLTVPADAVLDSGVRKTVFVDRGDGYLEPRAVETGDHFGDRVEIRSGLQAGERIVTSGTFLIDSESQLKSAAGGMAGHQHGAAPGTAPKAPVDHSKMPGMEH